MLLSIYFITHWGSLVIVSLDHLKSKKELIIDFFFFVDIDHQNIFSNISIITNTKMFNKKYWKFSAVITVGRDLQDHIKKRYNIRQS